MREPWRTAQRLSTDKTTRPPFSYAGLLLSKAMSARRRAFGMYYNGQGVQRDYAEATKRVCKAAERGYAPAQAHLGVMYWNGQGVPQDAILAYMWLNLAATH